MNKRTSIFTKIGLIAALILSLSMVFAGCYKNQKIEGKQDTSYVVTSNGGMSVQYGNYVYFVNGFQSIDDENGKTNLWGKVDKGGIWRAELKGKEGADYSYIDYSTINSDKVTIKGVKTFDIDESEDLSFKFTEVDNYDDDVDEDDKFNQIDVSRLVSKKIYDVKGRGIFIYDNYIYYATPNNLKDKTGTIQNTYVDIMRTRLDGKKTQLIHQSLTADVDYYVYEQNGKTYLNVFEGTNLYSYTMNAKKVLEKWIIAENVTSVVFPEKNVWYKGIETNKLSDFIYFTRPITKDDIINSGNVVEMIRPNGDDRTEIYASGSEYTLEGVTDNLLYFRETKNSITSLKYNDLAETLFELTGETPYELAGGITTETLKNKERTALGEVSSDYTSLLTWKMDPYSDVVNVWALTSSKVVLFENSIGGGTTVLNEGMELVYFDKVNNKFYFTKSGDSSSYKQVYVANCFTAAADNTITQLTEKGAKSSYFKADLTAGHLFYVVETIYDWAGDYTNITRLSDSEKASYFIGQFSEDDVKPDDEDAE